MISYLKAYLHRLVRLTKKPFLLFVFAGLTVTALSQDLRYDRQLGEESARQVEMMVGLYPDSLLNDYVKEVGGRLVEALGQSPFKFDFYVVDMKEPNAFALPGGFIYVSRGLLALVNDEAELAGVMGHEMIHVTKRHAVKQMRKSILPSILMLPGAVVGGLLNEDLGNVINAPISLGSELFLMNYSRKQERESDRYGVELASEAGYDPSKLAVILNNLSAEMEMISGEAEKKSYFSTHPFTPKRITAIEKRVSSLHWKPSEPVAENAEALYNKLEGMYVGPNPQQGIFKESLFLHPDMDLSIRFPENWNTVNIPVAVGAVQEDGNARIVLTLDLESASINSAADDFAEKFEQFSGMPPDRNESITINGFPSRWVAVSDHSGEKPVFMNVYWVQKDSLLLNLIGISLEPYIDDVTEAAQSLRNLTDEEKQKITGLKIEVAGARQGETIATFNERTGNAWDAGKTALMNGLEPDQLLTEGQLLKIAKDTSYF